MSVVFDKMRYSTYKVEEGEFTSMWNRSFCQMTIDKCNIGFHADGNLTRVSLLPCLSSFDKVRYSTYKVKEGESTSMWNRSFCQMTIELSNLLWTWSFFQIEFVNISILLFTIHFV